MAAMPQCNGFEFDIAFFDEAHRTAGNKNSKMFVLGMQNDFIPCKKRLFMTATERFVSPRIVGKAKKFDYDVFTMDNEEQYGTVFSSLSFRDAIEQNIISDYKIVLCCMNESELLKDIQKNRLINLGDCETDAQTIFKQVLLAMAMRDFGIKKVISYHRNIAMAQRFIKSSDGLSIVEVISGVSENLQASDIYAGHINGAMSAGARKEIFNSFVSAPYGVVSNARCLTEGVDVPIIDAVYFADPKNAVIDIIQAVGRSLRKDDSNPNKISYIIVPIIISDKASKFEDIDPQEFSTLHAVIQALRDQDNVLAEYIDELNMIAATGKKTSHKAHNIPQIVIKYFKDLEIEDFADNIYLRIAEINKDSKTLEQEFRIKAADRTSGVKRTFKTIGDYNIDAYYNKLVLPTLQKYNNTALGLLRSQLTIENNNRENHNNISHSERIGALSKRDKKFYITDIGKAFLNNTQSYEKIFREQLLKYSELDALTGAPKFPYRTALRVLAKLCEITRFEFNYSLYIVEQTGEAGVKEALDRIAYIRATYPNIEILNKANKEKVLEILNAKYNTTLSFDDIWLSRTTVYNQFNYIKKHLFTWSDVFDTSAAGNVIKITQNGAELINKMLDKSQEIEACSSDDQRKKIFTSYLGY